MFGELRHYDSGHIIFLICCVTSPDDVFKVLCEFLGGSHLGYINTLPFLLHYSSISKDSKNLICHVISQSHVIKGSCKVMSGSSSLYVTTLLSLVSIGIMVVEI